jgi:hypothetical protein
MVTNITKDTTERVALRLPRGILCRVEAHRLRLSAAAPGVDLSRTDAIRALLSAALQVVEARP